MTTLQLLTNSLQQQDQDGDLLGGAIDRKAASDSSSADRSATIATMQAELENFRVMSLEELD